MSWIRKVHLYSGLILTIPLLILGVTGSALIFKDDFQRARYPSLGQPLADLRAEQHANAFAAILERFPVGIRMIRTPREGAALYHVYLDGSEAFVSQDGRELVGHWRWNESFVGVLSELHFHLALGRSGGAIVGAVGLALTVMAVTGLILFWPFRGYFGIASFFPRNTSRLAWSRLHRDLGLLASGPILLFALTAAGVVFYGTAQVVLGALTFSGTRDAARPSVETTEPVGSATAAHIAAAQAALPGARLMSYNPPSVREAVHYFRFRSEGEPHPNGRSAVYVDGRSGDVLRVEDATTAPRGERAAQWLYPLHSAAVGGNMYAALAFLTAIALAVMSVSGPVIYIQARRRKGRGAARRMPRSGVTGSS